MSAAVPLSPNAAPPSRLLEDVEDVHGGQRMERVPAAERLASALGREFAERLVTALSKDALDRLEAALSDEFAARLKALAQESGPSSS